MYHEEHPPAFMGLAVASQHAAAVPHLLLNTVNGITATERDSCSIKRSFIQSIVSLLQIVIVFAARAHFIPDFKHCLNLNEMCDVARSSQWMKLEEKSTIP